MTERLKYVVIPTYNRPGLDECVDAIRPQVDYIIFIAHNCFDELWDKFVSNGAPSTDVVIPYNMETPSITDMWNIGLGFAEQLSELLEINFDYDVAVLNDDAIVPPDWFEKVTKAMRETGAVAGAADQFGLAPLPQLFTVAEPIDLRMRMSGFAYILDGQADLRADASMLWWYSDDDLDWTARENGGRVLVPNCPVVHPPNGGGTTVGELAVQAGKDRERFIEIWGRAPH